MSFYGNMAATAARLLKQFGAAGTLTRVTTGEYDPATGTAPTTTQAVAANAVVFDYDAKLIDGSVIQQGDKQCFMEVKALVPVAVDKFTWQGIEHQVIAVKPLAPAGVAVLYELQLRH